jgi:hypothetical protein
VQYGYHFDIMSQAADGSYGVIRIMDRDKLAHVDDSITATPNASGTVTVSVSLQNVGSPVATTIYSDFDERQATYVEGSATNGAVPVRSSLEAVQAIVQARGIAGLDSIKVDASEATAIIWTSPTALDSGEKGGFSYALQLKPGHLVVRVRNQVFGNGLEASETQLMTGKEVFLPLIHRQ